MLTIAGLSVALLVCLLSGGVEVETKTRVKVGGKVWFGRKNRRGRIVFGRSKAGSIEHVQGVSEEECSDEVRRV